MNIGIVCYASVDGSGIVATELGCALAARGQCRCLSIRRFESLSTSCRLPTSSCRCRASYGGDGRERCGAPDRRFPIPADGFQAGRDVVRRRFCAGAVVPRYEDYYREIVEHAE